MGPQATPAAVRRGGRPLGAFGGYDVTIVLAGDGFGAQRPRSAPQSGLRPGGGFACTHDKPGPMVEFYRSGGVFVARYNLETLLCIGRHAYGSDSPRRGLLLDGGTGASVAAEPLLAALRAAVLYLAQLHLPAWSESEFDQWIGEGGTE